MAAKAKNTLTIRFEAQGKDKLKAAFDALNKATKQLASNQQKLTQTSQETAAAQHLVSQRVSSNSSALLANSKSICH